METDFIKKSVVVRTDINNAWDFLSKISSLNWLENQKSTKFLSQKKRGVGTTRLISFEDGSVVKERIIGWHPKQYFSYIATSGLPLNSYHARISMNKIESGVKITWESYFSSNEEKPDFQTFTKFLSQFYVSSLKNLKVELEK